MHSLSPFPNVGIATSIIMAPLSISTQHSVLSQLLTGEAVIVLKVRAYNATGELALGEDDIPRGTTVLLTCDLEELPEGNVVTSYK